MTDKPEEKTPLNVQQIADTQKALDFLTPMFEATGQLGIPAGAVMFATTIILTQLAASCLSPEEGDRWAGLFVASFVKDIRECRDADGGFSVYHQGKAPNAPTSPTKQ
jgi:hypothetical protein